MSSTGVFCSIGQQADDEAEPGFQTAAAYSVKWQRSALVARHTAGTSCHETGLPIAVIMRPFSVGGGL